MDGLMAVPPLGGAAERDLRRLRPRLAMDASRRAGDGLVDLGVDFGLHPAFADLLPMWKEGRMGIVHCVGSPDPTRSHFDAQDYMESGTPGRKGTADGWLNRVVGELGHDATPFRAVSLTPALPRSLYGDESALAVTNLRSFQVDLPGAKAASRAAGQGFEALYEEASESILQDTARDTFEAVDLLEKLDVRHYRPAHGAEYPRTPLGRALQQIAFLVKSDVGLEVAFAESGGWDTHVQQGTATGNFARQSTDLARSIAAFWKDLGRHRDDVTVMTMTEFGRTAAENGTGGTDHGHGSCLFVLGDDVDGGKVHGDFPGLDPDLLYEGRDLPVTTDSALSFPRSRGRRSASRTTPAENGTGGTDHGHGSCLFVLGDNVDGGKIHGDFPGLDRDLLYEGRDLPVTTDFRAVFSEVAGKTFGIENDATIFPGWSGGRLPILRS